MMTYERKSLSIRIAILATSAILLVLVPSWILYGPGSNSSETDLFHSTDVSIDFGADGFRVRVDRDQAFVSEAEMEAHPLMQEAQRRITERKERTSGRKSQLRWSGVLRFGVAFTVILGVFLFRWWPRMQEFAVEPPLATDQTFGADIKLK